jgi:hypothetical protein
VGEKGALAVISSTTRSAPDAGKEKRNAVIMLAVRDSGFGVVERRRFQVWITLLLLTNYSDLKMNPGL